MDIETIITDDSGQIPKPKAEPWMIDAVLAIAIPGTGGASKNERPEHLDAFRIWFNDGEPIPHHRVAKQVGRSPKTISNWAVNYRWSERRQAIEELMKQVIIEQMADGANEHYEKMFKLLDQADAAYEKALQGGKVKTNLGDVKRLVETRMLLIGQPTERVDVVTASREVDGILNDPESIRLASALFKRLGQGDASGSG